MRKAISAARQGLSRNTFIPHTAQNRTHRYADKAFEATDFYKQTISLFPAMLYTRHLSGSLQETPPSCTRAIRAYRQKTSAARGFALTEKAFSFCRPHKHVSRTSEQRVRKYYN